jgi:hypothetical protein
MLGVGPHAADQLAEPLGLTAADRPFEPTGSQPMKQGRHGPQAREDAQTAHIGIGQNRGGAVPSDNGLPAVGHGLQRHLPRDGHKLAAAFWPLPSQGPSLRWLDIQIYKSSIIKRIHEGS